MKNKTKVLIVEDESIIALSIKRAVENFGFEVVGMVSNQNEVLRLIQNNEPDIIIMDIFLEGDSNGIELVKQIHKTKKIPVIYLTGHEKDEILDKALETCPIGYLTKPFRRTELKSTLKLAVCEKAKLIDLGFGYKFDNENMHLYSQNEIVKLSSKEAKLLSLLVWTNGELVTFETIDSYIWGDDSVSDDAIRLLVSRLRKKLRHEIIETVYGYGFKLKI